ncbi:unnamed protein product [Rotaria sordida]|nr:unnamed protein product [Rotaria sordida]
MTCPCGQYDYIDSTAETLADAMAYHRKYGNRIIHELLTGSSLFPYMTSNSFELEREKTSKMRLYQHSSRCPIALRLFLDCNPSYWCFIPLSCDEQATENTVDLQGTSDTNSVSVPVIANGVVNNPRVIQYCIRVPSPPAAYVFSDGQLQQQHSFFEQMVASPIQQLPYVKIDLYRMAIIAVLPDDRSIILRYIIETLFIIYTETKLNMICPIGGNAEQRYGRPYDLIWCANLNHSSM